MTPMVDLQWSRLQIDDRTETTEFRTTPSLIQFKPRDTSRAAGGLIRQITPESRGRVVPGLVSRRRSGEDDGEDDESHDD